MNAPVETLWARALRAADARGLLPAIPSLTPGELAAEAMHRGEDRLATLVEGWYYAVSYGGIPGALSDDEAAAIVAGLEAATARGAVAAAEAAPEEPAAPPVHRKLFCDLCSAPLAPI